MNAVMTDNLTKYYGKARGIAGVSLTVEEGDFFGFIGPNGAGKSTTIRTLLGLIAPTGGSAEIFGKDICRHRTEILADIGYLPSETMFYSGMRVKDVLSLSARLRKTDCSGEAEKLCERLELDTSRKIDELSLGNRKKVGIVCALQHRPKLYILDEPTSGLDPLMQREFYSLLQERNEEGATVFLSSHVLSEVQRYCKHAAVIREGRLLACDSVEKLGHTGAKRVTLRGVTAVPELEHIRDVKLSTDGVSFLYGGKADRLIKELSALPVTDITVAEPDLEEIFMHYYAKEDGGNDDI
ncbi:MAG: ABC transporter ATP-binding protein [Oscillospiraceae bacterium]|nr:ABC transporter ATP-binding protein [Oscillospiraceae bacterium]